MIGLFLAGNVSNQGCKGCQHSLRVASLPVQTHFKPYLGNNKDAAHKHKTACTHGQYAPSVVEKMRPPVYYRRHQSLGDCKLKKEIITNTKNRRIFI